MAGKKTQGRKKIEMKKIEDADVRRITFSKRRSGLFKKASELSTLCGIQIAIIVYSIGGKAFSFGHPSVESVIKRFEGKAHELQEDYISRYANTFRDARLGELNHQFNDLNDKLAEERNKRKIFRRSFKGFGCRNFEDFIDNIDLPRELMQVKGKLQMLKEYLTQEVKESPDHEEDSPNPETIYYLDKIGNMVHEDVNDYSSMEISRKHCHEFIFPIIGERAKEVNEPSAESSSKKLFVKNKVKDSSVSLGWLKLGEYKWTN